MPKKDRGGKAECLPKPNELSNLQLFMLASKRNWAIKEKSTGYADLVIKM